MGVLPGRGLQSRSSAKPVANDSQSHSQAGACKRDARKGLGNRKVIEVRAFAWRSPNSVAATALTKVNDSDHGIVNVDHVFVNRLLPWMERHCVCRGGHPIQARCELGEGTDSFPTGARRA